MNFDLLAAAHIADLRRDAERHRLVALARMCRPSAVHGLVARITDLGRHIHSATIGRQPVGPAESLCAC